MIVLTKLRHLEVARVRLNLAGRVSTGSKSGSLANCARPPELCTARLKVIKCRARRRILALTPALSSITLPITSRGWSRKKSKMTSPNRCGAIQARACLWPPPQPSYAAALPDRCRINEGDPRARPEAKVRESRHRRDDLDLRFGEPLIADHVREFFPQILADMPCVIRS
jgi:hypothetical protein